MSKSMDARVGAAGMNARNLGLSQEMTAGARWSAKTLRTFSWSFPSGRINPASAASSASFSPEKSSVTGSNESRSLQ